MCTHVYSYNPCKNFISFIGDGYDGHTGKQHILETAGAIGGGLIIAAMVFALLAFGICYYCRKRKRKNGIYIFGIINSCSYILTLYAIWQGQKHL